MCCGLIYTNVKNTSSAGAWQEFYVCSKVVKAKIFINGLKRWQKVELRPLANSFKLALRCRLLLYALFSVFLIQLSAEVEINTGPINNAIQISHNNRARNALDQRTKLDERNKNR